MPEGDALLVAGDFSEESWHELASFNRWLGELNYEHKIIVPGNHDKLFDVGKTRSLSTVERAKSTLSNATHILDASGVCLEGINIWGEPRQPEFHDWAFNVPRKDMKQHWDRVPEDTHILLTHGPPHLYGDSVKRWRTSYHEAQRVTDNVGCTYQRELVEKGLPNLRAVVCGHIHSGYGVHRIEVRGDGASVYNAAVCDDDYEPVNEPLTFVAEP
jgi:Icc-related predicted phosphoesterase